MIGEDFELEIQVKSNVAGTYCEGDTIELTTNLGDVGNSTWNDGTNQTSIFVASSGTYSVTTAVGCSEYEAILNIEFEDCSCDLFASNVFTPNGDGKNDIFSLTPVIEVARFNLKIYNRWGHLVFETNDINQGWDGMIQGNEASAGVYVWTATIMCIKNNQILDKQLKGYVSLLK